MDKNTKIPNELIFGKYKLIKQIGEGFLVKFIQDLMKKLTNQLQLN